MKRKSGLELMRIISMFFIVVYHIIHHSGLIDQAVGGSSFLLVFLEAFFIVHVNSFILLTGYFQSEKDAKLSKVIQILNANWFYKLLCFGGIIILVKYFSLPNSIELTFNQKIISILPLDRGENWYVNCYLLLYIISPFLNILINKMTQKKFKKLIFVLFIVFALIGTLLIGNIIPNYENGRCMLTFIYLYFIGAYLRKYPIEESRLFSKYTDKMKKYIFLMIYVVLNFIIMAFKMTSLSMFTFGGIFFEISKILKVVAVSFLSPFVIVSSIAYFLFFKNMKFSSRIINYIAGTTFGIYLLHENIYIRANLYDWLNLMNYNNHYFKEVFVVIVLGLIMFVICMIIEIIRKAIFKFFYNRKISLKIRNKIKDFIKSLGLDINY